MFRFVTLCILCSTLYSQNAINVSVDTFSRPMPLIGLNTNAHHSIANWTIKAFRESTAVLKSSILRYPGGTTANHWDWKTGWFQNALTTPPELSGINPKGTIRADEFKRGLDDAHADGLFVLNFQYSTLQYELQGLQHADSIGIPIKYIELGNEHNLIISNQFIQPSVYSQGAKIWTDTLKKYFPTAKVCLVGGAVPNTPQWHDSIFAQKPNIDALAFHVYLGTGNTDTTFNEQRALSIPFSQLNNRYQQAKFDLVPPNVEIWVTEYNMSENLAKQPMTHLGSWIQTLYVLAMNHIFLENRKITMIINHNLTNQLEFAAVSPYDYHITANGVAMQLLNEVSKGMTTATKLRFADVPMQSYQGVSFDKVVGWRFSSGAQSSVFIVNLSDSALTLDCSSISGPNATATTYSANASMIVSGYQSLKIQYGNTTNQIISPAYSVIQITEKISTDVSNNIAIPNEITLMQNYPNPFNPNTVINYQLPMNIAVSLKVYDILGKEVATLVNERKQAGNHSVAFNAKHLSGGVYFYRLCAGGYIETKKMSLLK